VHGAAKVVELRRGKYLSLLVFVGAGEDLERLLEVADLTHGLRSVCTGADGEGTTYHVRRTARQK
jgi:hypothetical protein